MLTAIDWFLDGSALLLSVLLVSYVLKLNRNQLAIAISCFSIYILHESWESGLFLNGTHREFELLLYEILTLIL